MREERESTSISEAAIHGRANANQRDNRTQRIAEIKRSQSKKVTRLTHFKCQRIGKESAWVRNEK